MTPIGMMETHEVHAGHADGLAGRGHAHEARR
jgi:hypothetical protein